MGGVRIGGRTAKPALLSTTLPGDGTVYRLVARHSGKAADVEGGATANNSNVLQWPWLNKANQKWTWIRATFRHAPGLLAGMPYGVPSSRSHQRRLPSAPAETRRGRPSSVVTASAWTGPAPVLMGGRGECRPRGPNGGHGRRHRPRRGQAGHRAW
jgi:hypothetical protein